MFAGLGFLPISFLPSFFVVFSSGLGAALCDTRVGFSDNGFNDRGVSSLFGWSDIRFPGFSRRTSSTSSISA